MYCLRERAGGGSGGGRAPARVWLAGAGLLDLRLSYFFLYDCLSYWLKTTLSAKYSVSPKHCVGTPLCWL